MSDLSEGAGIDASAAKPDFSGLARNAFEASKSYFDSAVRSQIDADLRQFYGIHPAGSKYHSDAYKGKSKLFRPKTRAAIRKNEAIAAEALFSTVDVVSITPNDTDNPVQEASAEVNKELLQYRLTKTIPWFVTAIGAYQDAQAVGICASYQYWRYDARNKGQVIDEPCIDLIPAENLRFDPTADWRDVVKTSPYFIHMMPMYVKDVKARMQSVDPKTHQPKWKVADENQIKQAEIGYSESTRQIREDKRPDSTSSNRSITDFSVVWVYRVFMEVNGQDMVWYCLANTYHTLTDPVPIGEMYWHGKRPYQVGFCVIETHKVYPSGVSRLTKEQQAEINEMANSRMDNVKLAMTKRWLAKRGKQVDTRSLTRNIPNSVTLVTEMEDVKDIQFNDVTASSYQEQDRLNLDFDDMAGTFNQGSVQSNRQLNETVGGLNLVSSSANQIAGYQLRVWIETWVEPVLRQLVLLEQHYESDARVLAIAGKKAQLYQKFGIDRVTDELLMQEMTLNVNVGMSATDPQKQVERFTYGLMAVRNALADGVLQQNGADVHEITKEVMGKLGYRDGERFFPQKGSNPEIEALQQQIQQLTQQLQAKQDPPELLDAKVANLEAQTAEIEARTNQLYLESSPDIVAEVEAQIADIRGKADKQIQQHQQTIQTLNSQLANNQAKIESDAAAKKYAVDSKERVEQKKAQLKSETDQKLADIHGQVEKRLSPVMKRVQAMEEKVKAAKVKKAA